MHPPGQKTFSNFSLSQHSYLDAISDKLLHGKMNSSSQYTTVNSSQITAALLHPL